MLKLLTDCDKCMYKRVCKYYGHPKQAMEKLKNTTYGDGPNDDYGWDTMMEHEHVDIRFPARIIRSKNRHPKALLNLRRKVD